MQQPRQEKNRPALKCYATFASMAGLKYNVDAKGLGPRVRRSGDIWEHTITSWIAGTGDAGRYPRHYGEVTRWRPPQWIALVDVMTYALGLTWEQQGAKESARVAKILLRLGWTPEVRAVRRQALAGLVRPESSDYPAIRRGDTDAV